MAGLTPQSAEGVQQPQAESRLCPEEHCYRSYLLLQPSAPPPDLLHTCGCDNCPLTLVGLSLGPLKNQALQRKTCIEPTSHA